MWIFLLEVVVRRIWKIFFFFAFEIQSSKVSSALIWLNHLKININVNFLNLPSPHLW